MSMNGPYYTLESPWVQPSDRGLTTVILHGGGGDPHIAEQVANTSCIMGCDRCDWGEDRKYHADKARELVALLNQGAEAKAAGIWVKRIKEPGS